MGLIDVKKIAFYLPQFHTIPENDRFWGEGYTEWVAVKNAKPLYLGHKQPQYPYNKNFYNLLDKNVMVWQSRLMKTYMIDGLCFYHYWFGNGTQALNKPVENLLQWKDVDMPFCFCWANESWLKKWSKVKGFAWIANDDSRNDTRDNIIFRQIYGRGEEWEKHFEYLYPFFSDKRYIQYDGKPMFMILCPDDVPCLDEMLFFWNNLAVKKGLRGIYVIGCNPRYYRTYPIDAYIYHEPAHVLQSLSPDLTYGVKRYSYEESIKVSSLEKYPSDKKFFGSVFCSYDNTPRYGSTKNAKIFYDSSPNLFEKNLSIAMAKCFIRNIDVCFIDAWNEWAEGMHLEPDEEYQNQWLKAVKIASATYRENANELAQNNFQMEENEYKIRIEESRSRYMVNILDRWIEKNSSKGYVLNYLKEMQKDRILIYGYGLLAKHFINAAKKEAITVVGIIDQNNDIPGVDTIHISEKLPEADAIVITSPFYTHDIYKEIRTYCDNLPVFTIDELLDN